MSMKHIIIPIFIPHLGCPFDCIYCNQRTIAAQQEVPDPAQVSRIIEDHLQTVPPTASVEVAFFGGSFTALSLADQELYLQAVQPFFPTGRVKGIRVSTRPDCIDGEVLDLLADYRVGMIELGVQSMDDLVLTRSARGYLARDVCLSTELIKDKRLDVGIQLMIGLPGDNYRRSMETTRRVIAMRPAVVRIYPTLVIAGTALARMWAGQEYEALSLEAAVNTCRDMFLSFQKEDIKVIRMGLFPGEELRQEGNVLAGPFHPSFGELVEQGIFLNQARRLIMTFRQQLEPAADLELFVNSRDLSKMSGPHRNNLTLLSQEFGLGSLRLRAVPGEERDWIGIGRAGSGRAQAILARRAYLESLSWEPTGYLA
jgi:histone acetyltransferase (RNA polymerase elongator complex component)